MHIFKTSHHIASDIKTLVLKLHRSSFYVALAATSALVIAVGGGALANALNDPGARGGQATGTGGLVAVEDEVDADEVTLGSTTQVVVRFRNDSSKEIKIGKIDLYPSSTVSATMSLNECGKEPLAPGAECAAVLLVKGIKTGEWRVEVLVRHDGRTRIVTAAITGSVAEGEDPSDKLQSDVEAIPDELDFGSLASSRPIVKSVVFRNTTSEPINVKDVSIQASAQSGYSLTTDCAKLEIGQACLATVTWSPSAKGQAEGVLMIQHDGPTRVASVDLKGDYAPLDIQKARIFPEAVPGLGLLVSSQESLDFGSVSNEASMTVSLVNVGDVEMKIEGLSLAGLENGLSISRNGCQPGTVLEPIEACPLTVTWAAPKIGPLVDDIQIRHDGARGVLVIPVRGTATSAVNRDTQPIVVRDGVEEPKQAEKSQSLEGFVVTSHSNKKAIINGPGGSRVVTNGQLITLGGLQWNVFITDTGVEFENGKDKVRLLFDRSLSSVNRTGSGSTGATSSGANSASTTTTSTPAATTSQ